MATNDLLFAGVLDASGSMGGSVGATIEGFNSLVKDQVEAEGTTYLSLTVFDTTFDVRFVGIDAREVANLGSPGNPYRASGGTALYDAVGLTIEGVSDWLRRHPDFDGKVVVAIWTDGGENSSHRWHIDALNRVIEEKQREDGWEFLFVGSGGSAWTEGRAFTSIPQANVIRGSGSDLSYTTAYAGASRTMNSYRSLVGDRTEAVMDSAPVAMAMAAVLEEEGVDDDDND